jgi:NADH:ubiquinone oxidoreductase subunit 6 (subunit J)
MTDKEAIAKNRRFYKANITGCVCLAILIVFVISIITSMKNIVIADYEMKKNVKDIKTEYIEKPFEQDEMIIEMLRRQDEKNNR